MSDKFSITLGGREIEYPRVLVGQLRQFADIINVPDVLRGVAVIDQQIAVILVALKRSHPELTEEGLYAFEATFEELRIASEDILNAAGLKFSAGEAAPQAAAR